MVTEKDPEPGPATPVVASVAPQTRGRRRWGSPRVIVGSALALASMVALWSVLLRPRLPQPGEPVARVTSLVGSVGLVAGDGTPRRDPVLQGGLSVGDALQVGRLSGAEISFTSGSILRVGPETRVRLGGTADRPSAAWQVQSGSVRFSVGHQENLIITPTARVTAPPGASGGIEIEGSGHTALRCFRGRAGIVTATGATVTLRERQAVRIGERGHSGETQTLPGPPVILSPPGQAEVPYVDHPQATVELAWEPVPGGDTYRVALSYNSAQARLVLPAALDARGITETRHALRGLDPGRYFWQVAAVNESGLAGAYSPASSFVVGPFPEEAGPGDGGVADDAEATTKVEP
jgi:hypothetical protein